MITKNGIWSKLVSNIAPIFPLPNTVFFPGIVLPLHIFEQRYQNMINDLEQFDNKIIISFGYKASGNNFLPSKISSIGHVTNIQNREDGKKDIIIYGNDYVSIDRPQKTDRDYLISKYSTFNISNEFNIENELKLKTNLVKRLHHLALLSLNYGSSTLALMNLDLSLDNIVNRIIFYYLYPSSEQQKLLEMKSLQNKYNYIKTYLTMIQQELQNDLENFKIPNKMIKKLN